MKPDLDELRELVRAVARSTQPGVKIAAHLLASLTRQKSPTYPPTTRQQSVVTLPLQHLNVRDQARHLVHEVLYRHGSIFRQIFQVRQRMVHQVAVQVVEVNRLLDCRLKNLPRSHEHTQRKPQSTASNLQEKPCSNGRVVRL